MNSKQVVLLINRKDAALERYKVIGIFSKKQSMVLYFIETMKSYCQFEE
jgi:hypothetical protein